MDLEPQLLNVCWGNTGARIQPWVSSRNPAQRRQSQGSLIYDFTGINVLRAREKDQAKDTGKFLHLAGREGKMEMHQPAVTSLQPPQEKALKTWRNSDHRFEFPFSSAGPQIFQNMTIVSVPW